MYYCRLPHLKPIAFTILVLWLGLLFSTIGIAASDFFCVNLSTIAGILGMSESLAGVTFLAFGNGSPDVFSTFAAMNTHSGSLAVGELIGAAGFITAVVAGSMAIVRPFKVVKRSFVRDVGFFIVASSFSIYFLKDGRLQLWECATMVGFYVFYVMTVVMWHWWLSRQRSTRETEAAARSHFQAATHDDVEDGGMYQDDEEVEDRDMGRRGRRSRGISVEDFAALERGHPDEDEIGANEDDETRDKWLAEISSNMRLSRPALGERRNTQNPIRPSLVGALEFRAVLSSLQKSRNIQVMPISLRRYSDDPTFTTAQATDQLSTVSDPAARPPYHRFNSEAAELLSASRPSLKASRGRAISANAADELRFQRTSARERVEPALDLLGPIGEPSDGPAGDRRARSISADLSAERRWQGDLLLRPESAEFRAGADPARRSSVVDSQTTTPGDSPTIRARAAPRLRIPESYHGSRSSSPASPFPPYYDYPPAVSPGSQSLHLPPPRSASPESFFPQLAYGLEEERPLSWWPYKVLPSPQVLVATMFPTLYTWREKNWWERALAIVAAPSVFVLAITLPVVELEKEDDPNAPPLVNVASPIDSLAPGSQPKPMFALFEPDDAQQSPWTNGTPVNESGNGTASTPTLTGSDPPQQNGAATQAQLQSGLKQPKSASNAQKPSDWNRWLIILQTFTAPFFIVLIVWANTESASIKDLLLHCLYSLIAALCVLALILSTTTPTRPPRWHVLLCFAGFAVSITWISTIANEVVGVLKAIGVILDISDAILGLTVFAVGNSLGDLVADITVARLGYPVMALSACFGGPMLNILLGIGISGLYITIRGAQHKHRKHPDRDVEYSPYHIEVSNTLLISGVSLLVTLVALLVFVPLRRWRMDRWIGWGLVGLWVVSTIGNLVSEIVGWGKMVR